LVTGWSSILLFHYLFQLFSYEVYIQFTTSNPELLTDEDEEMEMIRATYIKMWAICKNDVYYYYCVTQYCCQSNWAKTWSRVMNEAGPQTTAVIDQLTVISISVVFGPKFMICWVRAKRICAARLVLPLFLSHENACTMLAVTL
jgi:hypothetical protein